jgi:tetraacyldisaccharide 4'-kinase
MGLHTFYLKHQKSFQGDSFGALSLLAHGLSLIFSFVVFIKNTAYDFGVFKPKKAPIPIVSIGNIAIGGSGKTPFCICLAKSLEKRAHIGIISRGYGGIISKSLKRFETLDVCRGHGPLFPANDCGDEPYLIARTLSKLPFVVAKERLQAAKKVQKLGADIAIMDDGLQHRRLYRDIEIILLPQEEPFGKGAFFPRGELRDNLSRIKEATCIVITSATKAGFEKTKRRLQLLSNASIIGAQSVVSSVKELNKGAFELKKKRALAFAGIARPKRFIETLTNFGAQVIDFCAFPDHATLSEDDLRGLLLKAKHLDAECIVCTEKDAVKLPQTSGFPIPIVYVSIEHKVVFGKRDFTRLLNQIVHLKGDSDSSDIDDKRPAVIV